MARDHKAILVDELSPEELQELGDVSLVSRRLAGYVAPQPAPEETARLLAHLRPLAAARAAEPDLAEPEDLSPDWPDQRGGAVRWLRLAWSQTTLLEPAFWWASGVVLALGIVLSLLDQGGYAASLFALAAPVLAAGAVAYAFRPETRSLWELERTAPIQALELIYGRLGLVVAFNLPIMLVALGMVSLQEPRTMLWRLIIIWLGPLLALAGIAIYTTVRWGALIGAAVPLTLWTGLIVGGLEWAAQDAGLTVTEVLRQLIPALSASSLALGLSAAALLLGLALIHQAGRLATGQATWR